ncbi:MFS transporter [Nocardia fluminea]|uniref:MFS transporter n=1 Tax=Nocardia fluminea TaxID=134984 RepID=UPI0033DEB0A7
MAKSDANLSVDETSSTANSPTKGLLPLLFVGNAAIAAMALLGAVHTVLLVAIAWCVGQAVVNVYQAAITSVVPDRVPLERRGTASAAVGLGVPLGSVIGVMLASLVADHYNAGYLALGLLVAVAAVIFTAGAPEQSMAPKRLCHCEIRRRHSSVCCASATSGGPSSALVTMVLPKAEDAARDMGVLNIASAGPQILGPFVASAVVSLAGCSPLFILGGLLSVLGALAVAPIRSVR